MNVLSRWREGLSRTSKAAFGQIASILGTSEITDETWDDLEALLIQADLGIETTSSVLDSLKRLTRTEGLIRSNELSSALKAELRARLIDPPALDFS
ncbi:MAG: signal recognition particle receptor subunit alpha, partial [Anaerolineales bacterium]|nr:signal recognition particle receptor subunit alpha [Anaerolineales bacterium]